MTDPSQVESQRFLEKILHFNLSQKVEKRWLIIIIFWLLLFFGDEVDFSAGFPARPVGSLGGPYPICRADNKITSDNIYSKENPH